MDMEEENYKKIEYLKNQSSVLSYIKIFSYILMEFLFGKI